MKCYNKLLKMSLIPCKLHCSDFDCITLDYKFISIKIPKGYFLEFN